MTATVMIVDDERDLVSTIEYNLAQQGYSAISAYDGARALELAQATPPDLIILDLMLPDLSGIEVCRRLRQTPSLARVPVLILTARGEEIDRVVGLEVGADDYMVKPFSMRELMLRVRAILRRVHEGPSSGTQPPATGDLEAETVTFGFIRLDNSAHRVFIEDVETKLTALEFKLLALFIARKGRVQTREALLSDVWGIQADVTTRSVDTTVKRLREKLGKAGAYIETLRGVGYRFVAEAESAET